MTPLEFAQRCAAADPSRENAILCLKNLVEDHRETALRAVDLICATFPLGVSDIAKIDAEARRRYPEGV